MWCSRPRHAGVVLIAAGFVAVVLRLNTFAAEDFPTNVAVVVHADGSVVAVSGIVTQSTKKKARRVRFDFGLPRKAPERRWLEDDTLPICHTLWEKDGIRYTQTVLVTRFGAGDLPASGEPAADSVLMVQVVGENFTNDYTEATAELTVEVEGKALNLELRNDLIFSMETNASVFLVAIDVPASGIASTNGQQLRFQGNMPPGNTGAMTIKWPFTPPKGEPEIDRLRDLQFSEELYRVKRSWENRGNGQPIPLTFSK